MKNIKNTSSKLIPDSAAVQKICDKYALSTSERNSILTLLNPHTDLRSIPKIANALSPLAKTSMSEILADAGLTPEYRAHKLRKIVDSSKLSIALKALDQCNKLDGSYAPEKHTTINLNLQSYQNLLKEQQELLSRLQLLQPSPASPKPPG